MCEHPSPSTAKSKLPGMTYTHLTRDERYQIAILVKAGHDQSEIADVMNRHRSTISRELRRNRGERLIARRHDLPRCAAGSCAIARCISRCRVLAAAFFVHREILHCFIPGMGRHLKQAMVQR